MARLMLHIGCAGSGATQALEAIRDQNPDNVFLLSCDPADAENAVSIPQDVIDSTSIFCINNGHLNANVDPLVKHLLDLNKEVHISFDANDRQTVSKLLPLMYDAKIYVGTCPCGQDSILTDDSDPNSPYGVCLKCFFRNDENSPSTHCGKIELITGPMFSGKTSYLLNLRSNTDKIVYVKHGIDTRYTENGQIVNHPKDKTTDAIVVQSLHELFDRNHYEHIRDADVVAIDEGHFYSEQDFFENIVMLALRGKDVYIAALNGSYELTDFSPITALVPYLSSIKMFQSTCGHPNSENGCGSKEAAIYTFRCADKTTGIVAVGGAKEYEPLCQPCFIKASSSR